jgi:hypothetical protein
MLDMLTQFDPAVAGGIAASVLGVGGVATAASKAANKSSNSASVAAPAKVEKIDVSIPYDAAARFAYDQFRADGKEAEFEAFKKKYEQLAVAQATLKKCEREMAELN